MSVPAPVAAARATWPLTEAQLGLWFAQQLDPANPIYNTGQYVEIDGSFDVAAFRGAIDRVLGEAQALSIRVVEHDGRIEQRVEPAAKASLEVVDLTDVEDPAAAARAAVDRDMATPLDPRRDRLAAQVLYVTGRDRHIWYQRVHHLVIDGYGTGLLTARIVDLYNAAVDGRPPRTVPFGDVAGVIEDDEAYRSSDARARDRAFWVEECSPSGDVPAIAPGAAITSRTYHRAPAAIDPSASAALTRLARQASVPWPDALTAIVAAYAGRLTGANEVIVGVPSMERLGTRAARVPAMVMNVLPLRVALDEDAALTELVKTVSRDLRRGRKHGRYRSEQLRRDLGRLGGERRLFGPLVNILPFDAPVELSGARTALHVLGSGAVDDVTFTLRADPMANGLRLEVDANPALYSDADTRAHAFRLARFIDRATQALRLGAVPTLDDDERRRWTVDVNDTAYPVTTATLTDLIVATMARSPEAPAVICEGETLDYAALDRRSAALARRLAASGVVRGEIVGVELPRSLELVIALAGILRANAAYLPIDPAYPEARKTALLESARLRVTLRPGFEAGPLLAPDPGTGVSLAPSRPDDAAYVIFTSGSTGVPKGVVIEHRAIVNRLEWMRAHFGIAADDRILQKTPATFDVSVWELFLPLAAGAALVVAPPDAHRDPAWIARLIRERDITTVHFVPSMLAVFLDEPAARGLRLRRIICSGEELTPALRDRVHAVIDAELHNLYGPTEAAVDVTAWNASRGDASAPVPIGRPVWNTRMYVLDRRRRPVPAGVAGDLYIAGVQLARGYLGQPALTAERFVPDPTAADGSRMYHTGDVARWRPDGALEFLGRSDHQVKIRGQRIEPGEVEAALMATGLVAQAAVIARREDGGDARLVAYFVPASGREADPAALRAALGTRLPEGLMPSVFVPLTTLPLSSSGKLDRTALPVPSASRRDAASSRPSTPLEGRVSGLVAKVLRRSDGTIGPDDDFFVAGGDSLSAARLMALVREEWGCDLALGTLFANPTVGALARSVARAIGDAGAAGGSADMQGLGTSIRLREGEVARTPLFCIHPAGGISWCYATLARSLRVPRAVYGIQARGLDPAAAVPASLAAMAADYVETVRAIQPRGPYALLGWSAGGLIAHEMAVALSGAGESVALVALLDAYPSDRWREKPEPDAEAALKAILHIAGADPRSVGGDLLTRERVAHWLRQSGHPLGHLPPAALDGVMSVVAHTNRLVRAHVHAQFPGIIHHFRAALDHQGDDLEAQQWEPYAGAVMVHDVAALHGDMTGAVASAAIAAAIDGVDLDAAAGGSPR